jgi:DnaK suppressor protein
MRELEFARFKNALKVREAAVVQVLRKRDGIAVDRSADATDEALSSLDRELNAVALHRESCLLADVRLALRRIEEGSYGICQQCEETIGEKRLIAVPWARCCIRCQESLDEEARRESQRDPDGAMAA